MITQHEQRDYIGFAKLPEQLHRKTIKKGFEFTLMVVGESGLGKSTLINSLFLGQFYENRAVVDVNERLQRTATIEKKTVDIEENGVRVSLSIIDTPGFADSLNCEDSYKVCSDFIDEQFRQYFNDENGINRKNIRDNRVHCCLYFVPSYCHRYAIQQGHIFRRVSPRPSKVINLYYYSLRQIDIEMMKRLHKKVNLIVVIAKADTLTTTEKRQLKKRILEGIELNGIDVYEFPECDSDEDDDFKREDRELKESIPFAVVSSNTVIDIQGQQIRARQYPWGIVNGINI